MARARRHSGGNGETKQRRGNIVVIASGKGGVGKTTLAVNMGLHLARAGLRTVLVDADFGGANPELFLGTSARASLAELAPSAATPSGPNRQSTGTLDTLLAHATGGLELITAHSGPGSLPAPEGQPRPGRRAVASASSSTARALTDLSAARDFVLVDVGAGLPCELRSAVDAADWLLLVTTPEPAAGAAAYALLKLLAAHGSPSLPLGLRTGVVVNMAHDPHEAGQVAGRLAQAARDFLGLDLAFLGGIPPDRYVGLAARARRPLALCHPHAPANTAIAKICGRFLPPAAAARAEPGLWARLAGLLL